MTAPPRPNSQIVGALGAWMDARPADATQSELEIAAGLVFGGGLLFVARDDVDAPELDALDHDQLAVVAKARRWAVADEAERQERAQDAERIAQRLVQERRRAEARVAASHLRRAERAVADRIAAEREPAGGVDVEGPVSRVPGPASGLDIGSGSSAFTEWTAPEPKGDAELSERQLRRREIFWWTVCALAVAVLVWQLLL